MIPVNPPLRPASHTKNLMYIQTQLKQHDSEDSRTSASGASRKLSQTICHDCAFHVEMGDAIACIHPEELDVNCATVTFCNSFQPSQEIDSPCVTFGQDEAE